MNWNVIQREPWPRRLFAARQAELQNIIGSIPMKPLLILLLSLLASPLVAQNTNDLPADPSTVVFPPQPAPAPKQVNSAPQSKPQAEPASQSKPQAAPAAGKPDSQLSPGDSLLPPTDTQVEKSLKAAPVAKSEPAAPVNTGENTPEEVLHARVNEVPVIFTVVDKHNHFVRNLKKEDFEVLSDSRPVSKLPSFEAQSNLPLRVGLLIDVSSSIRERFKFEQQAAIEFLDSVVRPRSDKGFVLGFDSNSEITQDFTDDPEQLADGIRKLRPAGGTALYDAVYYACRDKLMKEKNTGPVRRVIVVISDGDDNQSRVTREEAVEMAERAEVVIFTISTSMTPNEDHGDRVLERLADATGGMAFFPFKIQDLSNEFAQIQNALRSQYALSFKPADFVADGRYHSIDIIAKDKKLHVKARKGYFAPKG